MHIFYSATVVPLPSYRAAHCAGVRPAHIHPYRCNNIQYIPRPPHFCAQLHSRRPPPPIATTDSEARSPGRESVTLIHANTPTNTALLSELEQGAFTVEVVIGVPPSRVRSASLPSVRRFTVVPSLHRFTSSCRRCTTSPRSRCRRAAASPSVPPLHFYFSFRPLDSRLGFVHPFFLRFCAFEILEVRWSCGLAEYNPCVLKRSQRSVIFIFPSIELAPPTRKRVSTLPPWIFFCVEERNRRPSGGCGEAVA